MKVIAMREVRIRTEDGKKKDFQKGETIDLKYYDSLQFYLARGFQKVETKDMQDTVTQESIAQEKKEALNSAKKEALNSAKKEALNSAKKTAGNSKKK